VAGNVKTVNGLSARWTSRAFIWQKPPHVAHKPANIFFKTLMQFSHGVLMVDYTGTYSDMGFPSWKVAWWDVLLRGIVALAFGLALFFWSGLSLKIFLLLFAAFAFSDGILMLLQMVTIKDGRWLGRLVHGVLALIAAATAVLHPEWTLLVFAVLLGAYWLVTGILQIIMAIDLRKAIKGELLLVAAGILSVIVGAILIFHPIVGILALAQVVGIFSIAEGIILVLLAAKLALIPHRAPAAA
jgi:uncharacterized membrane protein HdeD (DUF308 family)